MRAVRQFLRTHRVPLLAVVLAAAHSLLFWSLGPRVPLGLFLAAVMVSAWYGGLRSAVFATALSTPLLAVIGHYQTPGPEDDLLLRLGLFVLVGLIAGYLSQQCQQAIRAVEHVHDILSGRGIGIISADAAGQVTSLNPLARTLLGLSEADSLGRPLEQVFHVVHGPARQALELPAPGIAQELPEGALLVGAKGGETVVEGTVGPVLDGDGRPTGRMIVFREAGGRTQAWQELRQRADRFRALAGYAPAGLMVLDAEGRCVFCNPTAQSACACTADECLGEGWSRHVQAQDRDRLISDWLKAVVSKASFADEFRVLAPSGTVRWLRVGSAPMLTDNGEVLGHVAAIDDITDRKQAETALADARRESEEHLQEWTAAEKKAEEALQTTRTEAERRWQEQSAARAAAEEAARQVQAQLDERNTALRRAEEARQAAEQGRREEARRRKQAEDALARAKAEFDQATAEALAARQHAEDELRRQRQQGTAEREATPEQLRAAVQQVRDAWREEVEALVAMHRAARAALTDELSGHRTAHERLRVAVAEKDDTAESLRTELARGAAEAGAVREAHNQLQEQFAEKEHTEKTLRQKLTRLEREAAELQEARDRLQALLAQKAATEESLRREKDFLEGVIDGSPAGIFAHDRDGRCRVWNPALERLLGRPRADALGRTAFELFPGAEDKLPADDAAAAESGTEGLGRSALLETAHAPIRDAAGDVVGGMALVRELPMTITRREEVESEPTPHVVGSGRAGPAAHFGDSDWLGFN
jgi:PAS domain S-box-containing protein